MLFTDSHLSISFSDEPFNNLMSIIMAQWLNRRFSELLYASLCAGMAQLYSLLSIGGIKQEGSIGKIDWGHSFERGIIVALCIHKLSLFKGQILQILYIVKDIFLNWRWLELSAAACNLTLTNQPFTTIIPNDKQPAACTCASIYQLMNKSGKSFQKLPQDANQSVYKLMHKCRLQAVCH